MNNEHGFVDAVAILFWVLLSIFLTGTTYVAVTDPSAFSLGHVEDTPPSVELQINK
jgi:hypothetical protein